MMRKAVKISILLVILIVAYLLAANFYIYWRIGMGNLKRVDSQKAYQIGVASLDAPSLNYVALGDSLTSGVGASSYEESFPYQIALKISQNGQPINLENFSYPGARTEDLIRDLLVPAVAKNPDIVTLLIGTNDIHGKVGKKLFSQNYEKILQNLTTKTKADIYVTSIPNIGSNSLLIPPYNIYFENRVNAFNKVIKDLAVKYGVHYVDITSPTLQISKKDGPYYAADKFHPSSEGYKMWADIIYVYLNLNK